MILSANMLLLLSRQYSHEMANSIFYRLLASWAEMRGLDGTAKFFAGQSADEIKHAESVAAYIEERNEELSFDVLAPVNTKPATYSDAFTAAQDVERGAV